MSKRRPHSDPVRRLIIELAREHAGCEVPPWNIWLVPVVGVNGEFQAAYRLSDGARAVYVPQVIRIGEASLAAYRESQEAIRKRSKARHGKGGHK